VGEGDDALDDLEVDGVGRELLHALGEGAVQLEDAHPGAAEAGEVGVAGTEVVQGDVDAPLGEAPQQLQQVVVGADQRGLGDLQSERVRTDARAIVAVCTRGKHRQAIVILDLPLPDPAPDGAEWIEAYRHWGP
jgi:hypothetical protein